MEKKLKSTSVPKDTQTATTFAVKPPNTTFLHFPVYANKLGFKLLPTFIFGYKECMWILSKKRSNLYCTV